MAVDDGDSKGNLPEVSVSELAGAIKRTVEDAFGYVRLRGEVSGYRGPHSSGHCYFSLKDENARIDAVIWRGVFGKLRFKPEDGLEVIATGRVTTYPGRSAYQIVIERLEPAGVGALMALLEERRKKLAAEGLFDDARKQLLPYLPRVIGVVTSPTGAVIRDILHRLSDRFPTHVVVWPVRVQGETSGSEVAAAINGLNALAPGGTPPRPDLIIVARGGGSLEDLWGFNDEAVVRAAAESDIPLVSAVGHETDWTLIDHAADRRAPTPSAAAEFAVPVRADLMAMLAETGTRTLRALRRLIEERRNRLAAAARVMPRRENLYASQRQTLDRLGDGLKRWRDGAIRARRERFTALIPRLGTRPLISRIGMERTRIGALETRARGALVRTAADRRRRYKVAVARIDRAFAVIVGQHRSRFETALKLAASMDHRSVIARGYAIVRDGEDRLVRDTTGARKAGDVMIEFADGKVAARVGDATPTGAARPKRQGGGAKGGSQGSLF